MKSTRWGSKCGNHIIESVWGGKDGLGRAGYGFGHQGQEVIGQSLDGSKLLPGLVQPTGFAPTLKLVQRRKGFRIQKCAILIVCLLREVVDRAFSYDPLLDRKFPAGRKLDRIYNPNHA